MFASVKGEKIQSILGSEDTDPQATAFTVVNTVTELKADASDATMTVTASTENLGVTPVLEVQEIDISSLNQGTFFELFYGDSPTTDLLQAGSTERPWATPAELLTQLKNHPNYSSADFNLELNSDNSALLINFKAEGSSGEQVKLRDVMGSVASASTANTLKSERFSISDITSNGASYELYGVEDVILNVKAPDDATEYTMDKLLADFKEHEAYDDAYFTLSVDGNDLVLTHKENSRTDSGDDLGDAWLSLLTDGSISTVAVAGEAEVQAVDAQSIDIVKNETYVLKVGTTELTYQVTAENESLSDIVDGLKEHPDYDENQFSVTQASGSISVTFSEVGEVTEKAEFFRVEGAQLADVSKERFLAYSFVGDRPNLQVYDNKAELGANSISYDASQNTLTISLPDNVASNAFNSSNIKLIGSDVTADLDGRELRILEITSTGQIRIDTTGLGLPETLADSVSNAGIELFYNPSQTMEAYFEGSEPTVDGVLQTFDSQKVILREIGGAATRRTDTSSNNRSIYFEETNNDVERLARLGLASFVDQGGDVNTDIQWVDKRNPPVSVSYDEVNQRLAFSVDRTVLGTGTTSNFNAFSVYGSNDAESTNGLGIPTANNSEQVLIRGGEVLYTNSFIATGDEIQLNDKRYGINVEYNSDTKNFTLASGTTGETIESDGAIGVTSPQKASNIQVGRRSILSNGSTDPSEVINLDAQIVGNGNNVLMGFDANSNDFLYNGGTGLASQPAVAVGRAAQSDLTEVFRLNTTNGENIFNVSVNGINGIIEVPPGNYVGTTLAAALEQKINQIADPATGEVVGGVKVRYSTQNNNFEFITGTTGANSTIKVKGTPRLGLSDVPLGVGEVPKIFNLVQATNSDGVALYVDASGNVVTSPPEQLVEGYYPLYIDEGELTFDKTGRLVSPRNNISYEQQAEGFSISLDIDYSASTQFAQPFSVLSVEQDGFTSGRLDGLEIDSSGTIRANYTNGQNTPLGKIVVANFNNQNGLKQIGNATYVETAVSGTPQVGEAGSEGFGNILSGSLERSNVDITEELVNLITAQRNYQASAKAIETTTSLTQTIINIRM